MFFFLRILPYVTLCLGLLAMFVVFSENIKKIAGLENLESPESFVGKREELLGREIFIEGGVRRNKLSENLEIFANDIREIDIDKLIEELEVRN